MALRLRDYLPEQFRFDGLDFQGWQPQVFSPSSFEGFQFDDVSVRQDLLVSAVVDIGRGEIIQRLVNASLVVVVHEAFDLPLQLPGQIVIL